METLKTVRMLMTFQILAAFLASGASIPTTISSTSVISDSTTAIVNTNNSSLTDKPSCIVPTGKEIIISIGTCQPALNQLMQQPDPSTPIGYHWSGREFQLTEAPCIISLDCIGPNDELSLSPREIAGAAYWLIAKCEKAHAAWMHIDGSDGWLLSVIGAAEPNGIANATRGDTGKSSLLEDQGEGYVGLTENS